MDVLYLVIKTFFIFFCIFYSLFFLAFTYSSDYLQTSCLSHFHVYMEESKLIQIVYFFLFFLYFHVYSAI